MVKESFRITDPETMKALAHPLRQRIIHELSVRHSARAADLAEIVSEPANAISYHLRALAAVDLLQEAPELARDSRDRVWKLTHPEGFYFPSEVLPGAKDPINTGILQWIQAMFDEEIPQDPHAIRARYQGAALLTRAEAEKMFYEVAEVLERWREFGMDQAAKKPKDPERTFHNVMLLVGNRKDETESETDQSAEPNQSFN